MTMRVYVKPTGLHSRAMTRVSDALTQYAPAGVEITDSPSDADLIILHVISADAIDHARSFTHTGQRYAVIQYCYRTAAPSGINAPWLDLWQSANLVWSYYDLSTIAACAGFNFYHAPLGLDDAFIALRPSPLRNRYMVVTSGYVSGPGAEPIQDVWIAAQCAGIDAIHIGPRQVQGMTVYPANWNAREGISDDELAAIYHRATWVSAMRHIEGFELPGIEGLSCGVRPIVFDGTGNRHWYGVHASYVQDRSGEALIGDLVKVFTRHPGTVSDGDKEWARARFNWRTICEGFYAALLDRKVRVA